MAEYNEKEVRIRNVIDTEQNWLLYNPVLLRGEIGFAIKTGNQIAYKIGDGNTAWSNLPYSINTASEITAMVTNLQNQIDAIVTTSASGGDVAAEVAQSRVGADGTAYQTLKQRLDAEYNALTAEQTNLKEDLTQLYEQFRTHQDGYLTESNTYTGFNMHSISTVMMESRPNITYKYKGKGEYNAVSAIFFDSSKSIISTYKVNSNGQYVDITTPDDTSYVIFSSYDSVTNDVVFDLILPKSQHKIIDNIIERVGNLEANSVTLEQFDKLNAYNFQPVETTVTKGYIKPDGSFVENQNYYCTDYISIEPEYLGLYYTGTTQYTGMCGIAFYDSQKQFIANAFIGGDSRTSYEDEEIILPTGTVFIRACSYIYSVNVNAKKIINIGEIKTEVDNVKRNLIISDEMQFLTPVEIYGSTYIPSSGVVTSTSSTIYSVAKYKIKDLETVYITGSVNYKNCWYSFYDANNNVVGKSAVSTTTSATEEIVNQMATVPSNAVFLYVAYVNNSNIRKYFPSCKAVQNFIKSNHKFKGKKWVCVGDSLTDVTSNTTKHYYDYIADSTGIVVINMGMSGTGYSKSSSIANSSFRERVAFVPADADVVTIFGSFNDSASGLPLGDIDDTGIDTICGCINTTIDNLYTVIPTIQLGIISPTPWDIFNPYQGSTFGDSYVSALKSICEKRSIPFLDLYHCSNLRPWEESFRALAYSKDNGNGTHPDEVGHKIIAPRFEAFLDTLIS